MEGRQTRLKKIITFELEMTVIEQYRHRVYLFSDYEEACEAADQLYRQNKMWGCIIKIYRVEKTQEVMPWPNH